MGRDNTAFDRFAAWRIRLDLRQSFGSAQSRLDDRELILVRVDGGGHSGWGEAAPVPGHSRDTTDELWQGLRRLVGVHGPRANRYANGMLKAAFNQAVDDLAACAAGVPLWRSLGGTQRVAASAAIGIDTNGQPDTAQLATAVKAGYLHVKLKITPQTDADRIAAIARELPDVRFGVDANGSLGEQGLPLLLRLDPIGLAYIEQPAQASDLPAHARMRQQLATPICLDESAASARAIDQIVGAGAADIVNLKAGRFGTTATLALATDIVAAGLQVRLGGLLESGIGRAHTIALAANRVFTVVGDIAGSDRYFADDLVRPQWRISDGHFRLPSAPGLGVAVDEHAVIAAAVDTMAVG